MDVIFLLTNNSVHPNPSTCKFGVRLKGTPTAESLSLNASGKLFRRSKNNRYTKSGFEDILIVSSFKALVTRCIQEYFIVVKSDLRVTYRTKTIRFLGQVYLNVKQC